MWALIQDFFIILRAKLLRKLRKAGLWPLPRVIANNGPLAASGILEFIRSLPPSTVSEEVVARFIRGDVLVFGSHWIPADSLAWNRDFLSGYEWSPRDFSLALNLNGGGGADIKVPWEAARFQQWPQVAFFFQSGRGSKEQLEHARQAFVQQVERFISENPLYCGIHWLNAMEVSIRAINLALAYEIFCSRGGEFPRDFQRSLSAFLGSSFNYVKDNLEWYRRGRGNHYLINLLGLLFLGRVIQRPSGFAERQFRKEVLRQFLPDGGSFESSTYYHRLSLEAALLGGLGLKDCDTTVVEKLKSAKNFMRTLTAPDGTMPQIGDNDSGRILKFSPAYFANDRENVRDVSETLRMAEVLIPGAAGRALPVAPVARTDSAPNAVRTYEIKTTAKGKLTVHAFPDFGIYVWRAGEFLATVRCGAQLEELNGAHAHFDQLSLTLWQAGKWHIEDPGSYIYNGSPCKRNELRSPRGHHMPQLDDKSFRAVDDLDMFIHKGLPTGKMCVASEREFCGFYGFDGREFVRHIVFGGESILIRDELYGSGQLLDLKKEKPFTAWGYRESTVH